jgi:hypothetical protein
MATGWSATAINAQPMRPIFEGVLGIPTEPGDDLWDPHSPTSLLTRNRFIVTMAGQAADPLDRDLGGGRGDSGFSLGVNGGAIVQWDQGVTGVWVLGSGQRRTWNDRDGSYRVAPSPKIGLMTVSHAKRTESGWEIGGTLERSSFSLKDTFHFIRYPTSSDPDVSRYLYDLLPNAIGPDVDYEGIGSRFGLGSEIARDTRIGRLSAGGDYWRADSDWMTRHFNTMDDPQLDRSYLFGPKIGDGRGKWSGYHVNAAWHGEIRENLSLGVLVERGNLDGNFRLRLRNPARLPDQNGYLQRIVESATWLADTLDVTSESLAFSSKWQYSESTQFLGDVGFTQYRFDTQAFGRTPVLNLDRGAGRSQIIDHAAHVRLDGDSRVFSIEGGMDHKTTGQRWRLFLSVGLMQIDGGTDTYYIPRTAGFTANTSNHRWTWKALRLGYLESRVTKRITSQIYVSYLLRQYLPLGGTFQRSEQPASLPGDANGVRLGSLHQIRASLSL